MTDPRRQAWAPYIRDVADRLRLRDWNLAVDDEAEVDGDAAAAIRRYAKTATVSLSDDFLDMTPEEQRRVVTHEVIHFHLGHAFFWAAEYLEDGPEMEGFRRLHEVGIDGLADAIAPLMPLPGVNGKAPPVLAPADEARRLLYDRMHKVVDVPEESPA